MNKKLFRIIFPLFFIVVLASGIKEINWVSYLTPAFYLYFILFFISNKIKEVKSRELKYFFIIISLFGFWAMATALWSPYPQESFLRSIIFIVISWTLTMAGFCWIRNFSNNEFDFLIPSNILLLLVSVFSLMTQIPHDYWAGYGFGLKSFWGHQNNLASLIIFTMPGIFILPLKNRKIKIIALLILFSLNVYILILTHSRTSLAILIISILLFTLLSRRFKLFGIVILLFTCIAAFYYLNNDFQSLLNQYLFKTEVSLLDRKKPIMLATYDAAGHGGWKGLGFGISDSTVLSNLRVNIHYQFKGVRLAREKAVSIFALIEETGWVGLILFLLFIGYLFYLMILTYWKTKDLTSSLMICVFLGMCLHAQLEGWWLAAGSAEFRLFMGFAGVTIGRTELNSEKK